MSKFKEESDKDEIFYLPKHPINAEKHILDWFYTNDTLKNVVYYAYMKPIEISIVSKVEDDCPTEVACLKLTYRQTELPNCEGVSRYERVKDFGI